MLTSDLRKTLSVAITAMLVTVSTACGQMAVTTDEDATRAADLITQDNLRLQLGVIAHDSMRGRDTPSPELTQTAHYIADQFRDFGLEPGAGDTYIQTYPMTRISPASADRQVLQISGPTGEADLEYGVDFFVQATGESAEADGVLVLVEGAEDMPNAASQIRIDSGFSQTVRAPS